MLKRLLVLAILLLSATGARAAVFLNLQNGAPTANGSGGFTYTYDASLAGSAVLDPGDFFTLYDFVGLSGNVSDTSFVADAGLTGTFTFGVTSGNTSPPPPHAKFLIVDDPNVPNVTVTLGALSDSIVPSGKNLPLGTLTLTSSFGDTQLLKVASDFHVEGIGTANINPTLGPVPEPSTYTLMALGLLAVGAISYRARNRS